MPSSRPVRPRDPRRIERLTGVVAVLGIFGLSLHSIGLTIIARSITKPLTTMAVATQEIARGNLDVDLPLPRSGDEAGVLLSAFRSMRESLKDYIQRLTETLQNTPGAGKG